MVINGSATGLSDGTVVRIRVAKYRAKGQRWAKYRTVERVRVVDGAFTAEVNRTQRIRVVVKAKGVPRTDPIVLVRGRPIS